MPLEFEFPDTGEGVTEGKFLKWLVEEGEEIEEDQILAEAETDKAVVDIPAPSDGVVKELRVEPGDNVKVGDVIMVIDTDGEVEQKEDSGEDKEETAEKEPEQEQEQPEQEYTEEEADTETEDANSEEETTEEKDEVEITSSPDGDVLALPKVRKLAEEKGVDLASIKTGERITEDEVLEAAGSGKHTKTESKQPEETVEEAESKTETEEKETVSTSGANASPSVRKLAREKGVDISSIEGSGRGGTVTRNDVLNAAGGSGAGKTGTKSSKGKKKEFQGGEERIELSAVQKRIGERMAESKYTAPHVTHVDKADVTELVNLREKLKEKVDVHLTYLPFIMKATLEALEAYPELNAELGEENDELVLKHHYDFNIAVDTDKGLMIPLVEEVGEKSLVDLAEEIGDKAGAAKHGELSASDMRNGTFSITNLGVIGGEEFTPIINYPQTAILGIGKIQETAEVVDGEVTPRKTLKLSLSYDHRVVDGATAARFMNEIIENLENPEKMLLEI